MPQRTYSNIAVQTTLTAGINAGALALTVADATGYPAAPFAIVVDPGSATSEEVLLVTAKAGTTFTITRAFDGTTAKAHASGTTVIHAAIADDLRARARLDEANTFQVEPNTFDGEVVIVGDTDRATPLVTVRSGDFHASAIAVTNIPNADILYTAVAVGQDGNDITVGYDALGTDQVLTLDVVGSAITVHLATDSLGGVTSTANDVLALVNADLDASALVVATLAPGNDGTGVGAFVFPVQLATGALAADTTWIDERGVVNVQLQTGIGENALNIYDPDGTLVGHLDNDGGAVFSGGRFSLSQSGIMAVNTEQALPLAGNATLQYGINNFNMFIIAAGGGYAFSVSSPVASDIVFNIAAYTGQTGDLFVAFDEDFNKTFRILSNGDAQLDRPELGLILIDRTTATRYRLYVDSGVLGIEAV